MEAAAERALLTGACRYQSVKSILKNALDQQPLGISATAAQPAVDRTTTSAARSTSTRRTTTCWNNH